MASPAKITSIKDIRERKLEVKRELEVSKNAAVHTLQTTTQEAKSFVLRDVVLPAAGIALAGFLTAKALGYVFTSTPRKTNTSEVSATNHQPTDPTPVTPDDRQARPQRATSRKKPVFQSLLSLGKLLIPAGQAIIEVIQEERSK